jgi:hypothetical protein
MPRTIATNRRVDRAELLEFIRPRHHAILMTTRPDGRPQYFRGISGEHPDWDEYREAMRTQHKSLIRLSIEHWGPIATGGFPARLAD